MSDRNIISKWEYSKKKHPKKITIADKEKIAAYLEYRKEILNKNKR